MKPSWLYIHSYWTTCIQTIRRGPSSIRANLDIPLQDGIRRSQWFSAWSSILISLGLLISHPGLVQRIYAHPGVAHGLEPVVLWLLFFVLAIPFSYGFLRLFTLVNHVMTINVFKTRGQRLRLLNTETTLLSLAPIATIGLLVGKFSVILEISILSAVSAYILVLLGYSFNLIFHKQGIQGFYLVLGSYLVTWFVLFMGALAITVMVAVLAFFALAFLRLFSHHS